MSGRILSEGLYDDFQVQDIDVLYYKVNVEVDEEYDDEYESYDILIYDMDGNTAYEGDDMTDWDLENLLGDEIAERIINHEGTLNHNNGMYCLNDFNFFHIDNLNDVEEVNRVAKQIFRKQTGDYIANLHGYILTDGTCINLGYDDHNIICKIPGIDDKWQFIALGNIRCSNSTFDLIREPTRQQRSQLRKLIACSKDLVVDIFSDKRTSVLTSAMYYGKPDPNYVLGEIDRFFSDGIRLQGGYDLYESVKPIHESFTPDFVEYNGKTMDCNDDDAYSFIICNDGLGYYTEISENSGETHYILKRDMAARLFGYDDYTSLKDFVDETDDKFGYMDLWDDAMTEIRKKIAYEGRFWCNSEIITFWYNTPNRNMVRMALNDLSRFIRINIKNPKIAIGEHIIPLSEYHSNTPVDNEEYKSEGSMSDTELRNIHMMNYKDKKNALGGFISNRGEMQGRKLGNMTMAQYHSLINQESVGKRRLIGESTFDSWFRKSVLRDSEGNPLKMYHGTGSSFREFSRDFIGSNGTYEGYGFNFTPFRGRAAGYNEKNVIEAYLRAERPLSSKEYNIDRRTLANIIAELDKGKPYTDTIVAAYEPSRYNEKWDAAYYRRALPVAARKIYDYNKDYGYGDAGLYAEICVSGNADKNLVIGLFQKMGYDSVIFYNDDDGINTVIVFDANQIKLTTNKTFNDSSNLMDEETDIV